MIAALKQADWLGRDRVTAYARILLVIELAAFVFCIAGTHGLIVPLDHPVTSDFTSFYAAGTLANASAPWLVYDHAAHYAAQQAATQPGIAYGYFYYPPIFLLVCGLLARLPYLAAFVAFQAVTLGLCLAAARAILPRAPLTALLAFPAVFWTMGTGQNALLTAALFGGATVSLPRRPWLAGVLFGAVCYKPHLGLLIPVALIAGRHWRALAAAAATAALLALLSAAVFGWETWQAFLHAAAASDAVYATRNALDGTGFTNPYGVLLTLGVGRAVAGAVQLAVIAGTAALVWSIWRRQGDFALKAAILLAATPVLVPVLMFYDLMLTGIATCWLVQHGLRCGFGPWQKVGLAVLFSLPVLSGNLQLGPYAFVAAATAALGLLIAAAAARHDPGLRDRHAEATADTHPRPAGEFKPECPSGLPA